MSKRPYGFTLAILVLIAGFFRYYKLSSLPLGIYVDEAMNGNDGLHALASGDWRVFYPSSGGVEGLFVNLQAISIWLFGATPWALRAVSALMGVLTVVGLYLLVRDLYDVRHALIAGLLQAVLLWPVIVSRFGIRANMAVAILVWLLWVVLRAYKLTATDRPIVWAILAGILLGVGLNTYIAFRIVPVLILAIVYIAYRERKTNVIRTTLLIALVGFVCALPLLLFFIQHPEWLTNHINEVSALEQGRPLLSIGYNIAHLFTMFFYRGDDNWRHNFSGMPMAGWIGAPFILIALVLIVRSAKKYIAKKNEADWRAVFLLLWFAIGVIPGILGVSYSFPHGLRLILIQPLCSLLVAVGLIRVGDWVAAKTRNIRSSTIIVTGVLAILTVWNCDLYFRQYANAQGMHDAFYYKQYDIAQQLLHSQSAKRRYILVDTGKTNVWGLPTDAHTIAFLTGTLEAKDQDAKNIHYGYLGNIQENDSIDIIRIPSDWLN